MGRKTSINAIIIRYLPLLSDACSRSFNAKAVGFYRKGRGLFFRRPRPSGRLIRLKPLEKLNTLYTVLKPVKFTNCKTLEKVCQKTAFQGEINACDVCTPYMFFLFNC